MKRRTKGTIITLSCIFVGITSGMLYLADFGKTWNVIFNLLFLLAIIVKWKGEAYLNPKKK